MNIILKLCYLLNEMYLSNSQASKKNILSYMNKCSGSRIQRFNTTKTMYNNILEVDVMTSL